MSAELSPASYRDAAGFVYSRSGVLYRQVSHRFRDAFERVEQSGLFEQLIADGLLVPHADADAALAAEPGDAYRVLRPEVVPFISYPYEWSFGQLKDAALLTLEVQRRALARGCILRDASAYNVQFRDGAPLFIDTLSLAPITDGQPWYAYRQFCEHFLGPLALMAHRDIRLSALHRPFPDGVPLDLASRLLGSRALVRLGLALHVRAHAAAQRRYAASSGDASRRRRMSVKQLEQLAEHLRATVEGLRWDPSGTTWADYEQAHNYTEAGRSAKEAAVAEVLGRLRPKITWDLGANTGAFSRIAADAGSTVVALDFDPGAVDLMYARIRAEREQRVLPLVMDLLNPSPASGWAHAERKSLAERGPADAVLALALIHHLTLAGNVPLARVAAYFARLGRTAVVEFVPVDDPQARRLVAHRAEVSHAYTRDDFERAFGAHFRVDDVRPLGDSGRWLYTLAARG